MCGLLICMLFFPLADWDEHVQRCVLLHALCHGCVRLAHVSDEESCLWVVSPRQLLPVSTQTYTRTLLSIWSLEPLLCRSNITCVNTCQVVIHWDIRDLVSLTWWQILSPMFHIPRFPVRRCKFYFIYGLFLSACCVISCTSVSGSRLSQSVTVEEDNCCGCNVLAIRRHFLDRDLKQVHIVYTSCHDAVSNPIWLTSSLWCLSCYYNDRLWIYSFVRLFYTQYNNFKNSKRLLLLLTYCILIMYFRTDIIICFPGSYSSYTLECHPFLFEKSWIMSKQCWDQLFSDRLTWLIRHQSTFLLCYLLFYLKFTHRQGWLLFLTTDFQPTIKILPKLAATKW